VLICAGKWFTAVVTVKSDEFALAKWEIVHPTSDHLSIKLKTKMLWWMQFNKEQENFKEDLRSNELW